MSEATLHIDPARVRRVLIYRLGSLGDTVVALPALHLVERAFPQARRLMLTNIPVYAKAPGAAAILEGSRLVDGYLSYPTWTRKPGELARVWWRIRRFRPDVLVYLTGFRSEQVTTRDAKFFRLCGVRHIVGLPVGELALSRYDAATDLWEREAARLLRCLRPLGEADADDLRGWDLRLSEREKQKADGVLAPIAGKPLIACGPGTKMQAKDWGRENWRVLLQRLSAVFPDHALALIGAKEDAEVSDYAAGDWKGGVVNLCGQLTPRESAAVLARAELFLGPDSGPMHLAAAYGVPCAIAFAAVDRRGRWFPVGDRHRPVYHTVDCAVCKLNTCIEQQKKCILSITVEEMYQAAMEAWKNGRNARVLQLEESRGQQPCIS